MGHLYVDSDCDFGRVEKKTPKHTYIYVHQSDIDKLCKNLAKNKKKKYMYIVVSIMKRHLQSIEIVI